MPRIQMHVIHLLCVTKIKWHNFIAQEKERWEYLSQKYKNN